MTLLHRARHWLPVLPLLGILAATYWLNQQVNPDISKPETTKPHEPDGIMDNFSAVTLSAQGTPQSVLLGKQLVHYPDDDSSTVEEPSITSLSPGHPTLHATAKRALISSKADDVILQHGVKVVRVGSAKQGELVIHTEHMQIFPDKGLVRTDRAVTLISEHETVHAVGLEMDNQARTLKLLSQVKAEHAAPQK